MQKELTIKGKKFVFEEEKITYDHEPIKIGDATKILHYAKKMLDSRKIPFFLFWGTLLGAIREHSIIKGDDDIDIAILNEQLLIDNLPYFYEQGFKIVRVERGALYSFRIADTDCYIDIYIVKPIRFSLWSFRCYTVCKHYLPKKYFKSFDTISFLGIDCLIPNHSEEVLELLYGKTWRIPMKGAKSFGEVKSAYYYHLFKYKFLKKIVFYDKWYKYLKK